jgi:hypothetical protein
MHFFGTQDIILRDKYASEVAFDKTAFVKINLVITNKTLMKQIQNNKKSIGKSIPTSIFWIFKNLKKKIREPNLWDFQ